MLRLTYRTLSTSGGSITFRSIVSHLVSIERNSTYFAEISADLAFTKHVFLSVNLEEELWLVPSEIQVNVKIVCIISHSEATGTTPVEEETEINGKGFCAGSPQPHQGHALLVSLRCRDCCFSQRWIWSLCSCCAFLTEGERIILYLPRCDIKCTAGMGRTCQRAALMGSELNKGAQNRCKLANVESQ